MILSLYLDSQSHLQHHPNISSSAYFGGHVVKVSSSVPFESQPSLNWHIGLPPLHVPDYVGFSKNILYGFSPTSHHVSKDCLRWHIVEIMSSKKFWKELFGYNSAFRLQDFTQKRIYTWCHCKQSLLILFTMQSYKSYYMYMVSPQTVFTYPFHHAKLQILLHRVTANTLYLSFSLCKATNLTTWCHRKQSLLIFFTMQKQCFASSSSFHEESLRFYCQKDNNKK